MRQLAKARVAKNAVDKAVCPEGKALKRELSFGPFQVASVWTFGRARPVEIFTTRAASPAKAQAKTIAAKIRSHFLLPRQYATAIRTNPTIRCSGQSPQRLTASMNFRTPGSRCWVIHVCALTSR